MSTTGHFRTEFIKGLWSGIKFTWPLLSGILMLIAALGALVGWIEGWGLMDGIYFAFVTGLTVGYGDLTPKLWTSRVAAIAIGFTGVLLTGLVAAISVQAYKRAMPKHAHAQPGATLESPP